MRAENHIHPAKGFRTETPRWPAGQQSPKRPMNSWVEWRANRMDDPVARLRYLRSFAPPLPAKSRGLRLRAGIIGLVAAAVLCSGLVVGAKVRVEPLPVRTRHARPPVLGSQAVPNVWLVEKNGESEIYSNGLRIESRFEIATHARSYRPFALNGNDAARETRRTDPAGIVFHSTESLQAPFEPGQNRVLKQVGESTLEFVRRHHAYNFLIDRFGRVFRVVKETDAAEHAGYSVWADEHWLYINLNESFIGVSFEAKTNPGQEELGASPAQTRAASMLTEMLRSRYAIPVTNCVTHAQVSVNPNNMRIGWHTDWASSFPFEKLGLPNNYALPLPALTAFGFEYDDNFVRLGGPRLYAGVEAAEERLQADAARQGITVEEHRRNLRRLYHDRLGRIPHQPPPEEHAE